MSALERLCERLGIKCSAVYGGELPDVPDGWPAGTHPYRVILSRHVDGRRRQLTIAFYMGPANTREPTAADVLACLVSDARAADQSFDEFCSDFGYDNDSRKAFDVYTACERMGPRVRRFLGEHFDAVANADH